MIIPVQVGGDGQPDAQQQEVGIVADRQLAEQAAAPVPAALEEGLVRLGEGRVRLDLGLRQRVDAGRADVRDVDPQLEARVDHVEHTEHVGPHRLDLVVLAPVGVGVAARAGAVDDSGGLVLDELAVRHTDQHANLLAEGFEENTLRPAHGHLSLHET